MNPENKKDNEDNSLPQNESRKTYALPIGPQHPLFVEAENLTVHLDGETIVDVDLNIGYMHRGIEEMMQRRNYIQNIYLSERICGICMPGEHEIILGDGSIVRLAEIIDEIIKSKPNPMISVPVSGYSVMASNDMHVKPKNILAVQKVKCPSKLFRIKTMSGTEMKFTGDHPIMVDTIKGPKMIKANEVEVGDRVYSPRKISVTSMPLRIIDCIPDNFKIILDRKYYLKLSLKIREKYGTLLNCAKKTGINPWRIQRMRYTFRIFEFKKLCEFMELDWKELSNNIIEVSVHGLKINLAKKNVTEEMMNVLGLLASDGYFGNKRNKGRNFNHRITFVNKQVALIKMVERLHKKLFPDKKADRFIMNSNTPAIRISNPVLTFIARRLGLNALDRKTTDIKEIFKLPEGLVAAFLRGYFDSDGTCHKNGLIYYTSDALMAKRIRLLLKRIGIASSISSSSSNVFKRGTIYSISITNQEDIIIFAKKIGSNHPKKMRKIDTMKTSWEKKTFHSMFQLAPRKAGPILCEIRKKYRISPQEIGAVSDLNKIENGTKNVMKWRIKKYLDVIKKSANKDDSQIAELEEMLSNKFFVEPIKEIEEIGSNCEYVYDLTVDDVHNFIPEGGFVVGNCSGIHSVTFCMAVENMLEIKIPERANYIRTILLELERLHSHLLFLGVVGYEMGLDTLFQYAWKDREIVMDLLEDITGNRVNYALPTIGGVRRNISENQKRDAIKAISHLNQRFAFYKKIITTDRTIRKRTVGIGILPKKDANRLSIQGPVLRASGVNYDVRAAAPYAAYNKIRDWNVIVRHEGDVHARVLQKIMELIESSAILVTALMDMPDGDIKVKAPLSVPEAESVAFTEAPRGELVYYARSNGTDTPDRMRIRTPSFSNMLALPVMLKGEQLADLPVIVGSIDPCFSCTDRVTLIDSRTGNRKVVDKPYLMRLEEKK